MLLLLLILTQRAEAPDEPHLAWRAARLFAEAPDWDATVDAQGRPVVLAVDMHGRAQLRRLEGRRWGALPVPEGLTWDALLSVDAEGRTIAVGLDAGVLRFFALGEGDTWGALGAVPVEDDARLITLEGVLAELLVTRPLADGEASEWGLDFTQVYVRFTPEGKVGEGGESLSGPWSSDWRPSPMRPPARDGELDLEYYTRFVGVHATPDINRARVLRGEGGDWELLAAGGARAGPPRGRHVAAAAPQRPAPAALGEPSGSTRRARLVRADLVGAGERAPPARRAGRSGAPLADPSL